MGASESRRECYSIGDLHLDVGAVQLRRGEDEINLPPLSFRLLVNLVRTAPDMATQQDLLRSTWGDVIVSDETLKQRVKLLRDALGDDSTRPRYIATVRGRGYKLIPLPVPVDGRAHGARAALASRAERPAAERPPANWVRNVPGGWLGVAVAAIVITALLGIALMIRGGAPAANGSVLHDGPAPAVDARNAAAPDADRRRARRQRT